MSLKSNVSELTVTNHENKDIKMEVIENEST